MALFLVHFDVLVAPEPDKISRKKCTPTVALLHSIFSIGFARDERVFNPYSCIFCPGNKALRDFFAYKYHAPKPHFLVFRSAGIS